MLNFCSSETYSLIIDTRRRNASAFLQVLLIISFNETFMMQFINFNLNSASNVMEYFQNVRHGCYFGFFVWCKLLSFEVLSIMLIF